MLGPGGAGKSVLSRELAGVTGLPLVHLDREYWKPGWVRPARDEWLQTLDRLLGADAWIVDGTHADTLDHRLKFADGVVVLDYSRWVSIRGVVTRLLHRQGRRRADLAPGCPNRLDRDYASWLWTYPRETRPQIREALARHPHIEQVALRNRRDTRRWLDSLRAKPTRGVIDG